jgi:hypothetical protein
MCPYGTDIMDHRNNMVAVQKYQVQNLIFVANRANDLAANALDGKTFALTFKSKLNETFTTKPIVFRSQHAKFHSFILNVQQALLELPNRVIDKVVVQGNLDSSQQVHLNISFVGDHVQGPQFLLVVRSYLCGDGCSPKVTGLELHPGMQNVSQIIPADFNSYECGRRGKCDYTSGICTCFEGYTGLACNTITALV